MARGHVLLSLCLTLSLALAGCLRGDGSGAGGGLARAEVTFDGTTDPATSTAECAGSTGSLRITGEVTDGAAHVIVRDDKDEVAYYKHFEKGAVNVERERIAGAVGEWTLTVQSTPLDSADGGGSPFVGNVQATLTC